MALVPLIIWIPSLRVLISILFGLYVLFLIICLLPGKRSPRAMKGTMGHVVGEVQRVDERDILFARVEGLQPGTEQYHEYYEMHPENKAYDDRRRESGGFPVGPPGAIDKGYPPTVAMTEATFHMCFFVGDHAVAEPLVELLRSRARSEGMSINRMIKKLLEETLDVTPRYKDANRGDCEEFYGMWSESDLREFEKRTEEFRQGNLWLTPAGEDSIPNNI